MNEILRVLEHEGLIAEGNTQNATLTFTGTWEQHDIVRETVMNFGNAIPLPEYPETHWPQSPPDSIPFASLKTQGNHPLIRTPVDVQHVSAVNLAKQLTKWIEPDARESIIPLPAENTLLLVFPEEKIETLQKLIQYLDDPVWHVHDS